MSAGEGPEVSNGVGRLDAAELLATWRAWHLDQDHRPATIDNYQRIAGMWTEWLAAQQPPVRWWQAGPAELRGFLDGPPTHIAAAHRRRGEDLTQASRVQYTKVVRLLYRWACDEGLVPADPLRRVRRPRQPDPIPRALELDDVAALLDSVAGDERARVAVWLAYGLGMRRSEIAAARIEDVRLRGRAAMLVHGKGGRDRLVPLPDLVREVLAGYLAGRPRNGPLLESWRSTWQDRHIPTGRALRPGGVGQMIADAMRAAGIDETGHALRHTFATLLLEAGNGQNLRAVSRLLGHSSTVITEKVYTSSFDGDARATAEMLPDPRRNVQDLAHQPPLDPEMAAWQAKLEEADPGLLQQIAATRQALGRLVEEAAPHLGRVWGLTDRLDRALHRHADPLEVATDVLRERLQDAAGLGGLYELADRLRDAHPDEHRLSEAERVVWEAERALLLDGLTDEFHAQPDN